MDEYLVPTQFGEDEFYEKKSHFIGRAWPVETEEEALEKIQHIKKQHYDATHNCWAYIIKDGAVRFSDDANLAAPQVCLCCRCCSGRGFTTLSVW